MKFSDLIFIEEISRVKKELGPESSGEFTDWRKRISKYFNNLDTFIHFSNYPKFGIYYNNKFDTPTGFYAYFLASKKISTFGTDRPYMIVFKVKDTGRFLKMPEYNEDDFNRDIGILQKHYPDMEKYLTSWKESSFREEFYSYIWNITRQLASWDKKNQIYTGEQNVFVWNRILSNILGYDGAIDDCTGTIHGNERCQAVFFNMNALELLEIIEKKEDFDLKNKLIKMKKFNDEEFVEEYFQKDNNIDKYFFNNSKFLRVTFEGLTNLFIKNCNGEHTKFRLTETKISNSSLIQSIFSSTSNNFIKNSNVVKSKFLRNTNMNIEKSVLDNSIFSGYMNTSKVINSSLKNIEVHSGYHFKKSNFKNCVFDNSVFKETLLSVSFFEECDLGNTVFDTCYFEKSKFSNCNLENTTFINCSYDQNPFPEGFIPKGNFIEK